MNYVAAIYVKSGKIVTGSNHGEAFSKMSIEEKDGLFLSGFIDPQTGQFLSDETTFYTKELILIRHSEIEEKDSHDPELSDDGRLKADDVGKKLLEELNLSGYSQFAAHATRCQQTARIINTHTRLGVQYLPYLKDISEDETTIDFIARLKETLDYLPNKSLIVSHCNCILNLAQLALGLCDISSCSKWNGVIPKCSVTYVNGKEAVWIGHELAS